MMSSAEDLVFLAILFVLLLAILALTLQLYRLRAATFALTTLVEYLRGRELWNQEEIKRLQTIYDPHKNR